MIFPKYKCIFIHIPKTAGTSIIKVLMPEKFDTGKPPQNHSRPFEFIKSNPSLWQSYFTFTFVRNPWDRFVSSFLYNAKVAKINFAKTGTSPRGIRKVILDCDSDINKFIIETPGQVILKGFQFPPQTSWLCNGDTYIQIDFIGRFENLQEDFNYVCDKIGLKPINLPHENPNVSRKRYQEYYTEETKKIVYEYYKTEIEYFNYKFE